MEKEISIKVNARHVGQLGRELVTSAHTTLPPESNRRLAHHSVLPQMESIPYIRESIISITSAVSTA